MEDVTFETDQKAERLLMITAESPSSVPNVNRLCEALGTTRDSCLKMLYALDRAGVMSLLAAELKNSVVAVRISLLSMKPMFFRE